MEQKTIIWDFDGTLLPIAPWDSEQTLIRYKLDRARESFFLLNRLAAEVAVLADRRQILGKWFKKFYVWFIKGTRTALMDTVAKDLAPNISESDKSSLRELKAAGFYMLVLSCGTVDLSERVLESAGIKNCFDRIVGNRFNIENNRITGMAFHLYAPKDKVAYVNSQGFDPKKTVAIGDGYTDLPLLDWCGLPIMIDRSGEKKSRWTRKKYHIAVSIGQTMDIIKKNT